MPDRLAPVADAFAALAAGELAAACRQAVADLRATGWAGSEVLDRLADAYGLSPFEADLLVLTGLPEEHEAFARLARSAHPLGESRLSIGAVAATLGLDAGGRAHLREVLETGPLVTHGLLLAPGAAPLPDRGLHLADRLWSLLRGGTAWPAGVEPMPVPVMAPEDFPEDRFVAATLAHRDQAHLVLLSAERGRTVTDLAAHAVSALGRAGRRAVVLPPAALEAPAVGPHLVARGVVPVVAGACESPPLPRHPGPVVVCVPFGRSGAVLDERSVLELGVAARSLGAEQRMWQTLVPELNGASGRLAGVLRVDAATATHAVEDARLAARTGHESLGVPQIVGRARRRSDARLPASVRRSSPTTGRARLVTTERNDALLTSLLDRMRGQVRVLHEWGFAGVGGVRGVRALFSGPPGTGKTLSAQILAAELGLDLLSVDLSALVSKWLGETEKNIGEVFEAAELCQAVLFFDEADAIFGRRTDAGDAQARWANLETAYLLSRIDEFDGLVVLATNLRSNIDEAFVRRIDVIIEYDDPEVPERERLWRAHLPDQAPLAADVDPRELAEPYAVSGGVIRNAALSAAFHAAEHGREITQSMLVEALRREYDKSGRTFPGAPRIPVTSSGGN
ncbi:ATP-binding protein [Nocardioides ginsengisoli]|uniref:ATP-binding protein n=1 Tax=Nocardioides ginsengisoli TaxID=363868 RepID=A0ABW3W030_9ACTN